MKLCQGHLAKLRAKLGDLGLSDLCARDDNAYQNIFGQPDGDLTARDPLEHCLWMIYGRAMNNSGAYRKSVKEAFGLMGNSTCPICEAITQKPVDAEVQTVEDFWIEGPADAALSVCRKNGLAPTVQ